VALDLFVSKSDAVNFGRLLGWKRTHRGSVVAHPIRGEHRVLLDTSSAPALAAGIAASIAEREAARPA
jgi:hypothetical protein